MASAEFDREADALYVRLADGDVARTVEVDEYRIVDLDDEGQVLGLEVLYPSEHLEIASIAQQYGFADQLSEIDQAVGEAMNPPVVAGLTFAIASISYVPFGVAPSSVGVTRSEATSTSPQILAAAN